MALLNADRGDSCCRVQRVFFQEKKIDFVKLEAVAAGENPPGESKQA